MSELKSSGHACLREVGEGGGLRVEGWDGFDQAGDGESVANAAGPANQPEDSAFARKLNGDAHECGKAGAVDLGDGREHDDDLAHTAVNQGLEGFVELIAGFADGEPAVNVDYWLSSGLADVDLHGYAFGHHSKPLALKWNTAASRLAEWHYTLEDGLHKEDVRRSL